MQFEPSQRHGLIVRYPLNTAEKMLFYDSEDRIQGDSVCVYTSASAS